MSAYSYRLTDVDAPAVAYGGGVYRTGDTFETDDYCELIRFMEAAHRSGRRYRDMSANELTDDLRAVAAECRVTFTTPTDAPTPASVQPTAVPSGGRPDTPASLGAPPAAGDRVSGPRADAAGRPAATRARDPQAPVPVQQIADEARRAGASQADAAAAAERARRGEPDAGAPHPSRSDERASDATVAGDPVDLYSGELLLESIDLELPSRGLPLRLFRVYSSGRPSFGPWGFQWDHNYNVFARPLRDGRVSVWAGGLREHVFAPGEDGSLLPPAGVDGTLRTSESGFQLRFSDGIAWRFERPTAWPLQDRIPLVTIEDEHDNRQTLAYDAKGRLSSVTDAAAQFFRFTYGECDLLEVITDSADRVVTYFHASNVEHLVAVKWSHRGKPQSRLERYEYLPTSAHPALAHNIVRVIDELGVPMVENEYGVDPDSDSFNRVTRQFAGGIEMRFAYERLSAALPGRLGWMTPTRQTVVATADAVRVVTFDGLGNLIDERMRLRADGSYRVWQKTYAYDQNNAVVEERLPSGLTRLYRRDSANPDPRFRGRVREVAMRAAVARGGDVRRVSAFEHESSGRLVRVTNAAGHRWDLGYAPTSPASSGPDRIELPPTASGPRLERMEHDRFGQLIRHVSPTGVVTRYAYDDRGLLTETTLGEGADALRSSLSYERDGSLATATDPTGLETRFEYDGLGRLIRQTQGAERELRFEHDVRGRVVRVWHPSGDYRDERCTGPSFCDEYRYDDVGRLIQSTRCANTLRAQRQQYRWDSAGRLIGLIDALGREFGASYDERGLPLREWVVVQNVRVSTTHAYDLDGNPVRREEPSGRVQHFEHDRWGRLETEIESAAGDPRRVITRTRYDALDQPSAIRVTQIDEGGEEELLSEVSFETDEAGRVVAEDAGEGQRLTYTYDDDDRLTGRIDWLGRSETVAYDEIGRERETRDALGRATRWTYGADGRRVEIERLAPSGAVCTHWAHELDAFGRVIRERERDGTVFETSYDARGAVTRSTSSWGPPVAFTNDVNGFPLTRTLETTTPVHERWERDVAGRVTEHVDPSGATTRFVREHRMELTRIELPDGSQIRRRYSPAGDLVEETLPSGTRWTYEHDAWSQLVRAEAAPPPGAPDVAALHVSRDGLGRPTRVTMGDVVTEFAYDRLGRTTREKTAGREVQWEFAADLRSHSLRFPDGRLTRYRYDALGRVASIVHEARGTAGIPSVLAEGSIVAELEYGPEGAPARRRLGNGVESVSDVDALGRVTRIQHLREGAAFAEIQPSWSASGRLQRTSRSAPDLVTTEYRYDEVGHLVRASDDAGHVEEFDVDASGDRISDTRRDGATSARSTYHYDTPHRLARIETSAGGAPTVRPFTMDAGSNVSSDGPRRYVHDAYGHLREVWSSGGALLLRQTFDGLGRVYMQERSDGRRERLTWSGGELLQREDDSGVIEQIQYGEGLDDELMTSRRGQDVWHHSDERRSLAACTDARGRPLAFYRYDAFGRPHVRDASSGAEQPLADVVVAPRFAGRPYDAALGLYDVRARWYDPTTGRFLEPDPSGHDAASPYVYVAHDPINFVDPTGEWAESAWDLFSLSIGIASAANSARRGHWGDFALDLFGCVVDAAALIVPLIPGGVGLGIKALRAGGQASRVLPRAVQIERAVRSGQFVNHGVNVYQGVTASYQSAREGDYGWSAFHAIVSYLGVHGMTTGVRQIRQLSARAPDVVHSIQGNRVQILRSRQIYGQTEGMVWGHPLERPRWWQSGVDPRTVRHHETFGARYVFTGNAARRFRPVEVSGPYSLWKYLVGQMTSGFGDLMIRSRPMRQSAAFVYEIRNVARITGRFSGQSARWASARLNGRRAFDHFLNAVPGGFGVLFGALASTLEPSSTAVSTHRRGVVRATPGSALAPDNPTPKPEH